MADDEEFEEEKRKKSEFDAYGCLLVGCCCVLRFLSSGISQSIGLILRALIEEFNAEKSEANGIGSVSTGLMLLLGPLAGYLTGRIGDRGVVILGSITSAIGFGFSMFVPELHYLYITHGVITGFGFSLINLAAMVPITVYFNERRTFANSLATIGGGIGTCVMPFLMAWLMEEYGWRGLYLILAGLSLQGVVVGMLLRKNDPRPIPKKNALLQKRDAQEEEIKEGILQKIKALYTNKYFVLYGILSFCVDVVVLVPFFMVPVIAASIGLSPRQQAMIITAAGITSTLFRPVIAVFVDRVKSFTITISGIAAIILGVATIGLVYFQHYPSYVIYGCILGITHGTYLLLKPIALIDIIGREGYALGLGFFRLFSGTAVLVGPPIAGMIMDIRGHFDWLCFYATGLFTFGGCCLIIFNFFLRRRHLESQEVYEIASQTDSKLDDHLPRTKQ